VTATFLSRCTHVFEPPGANAFKKQIIEACLPRRSLGEGGSPRGTVPFVLPFFTLIMLRVFDFKGVVRTRTSNIDIAGAICRNAIGPE